MICGEKMGFPRKFIHQNAICGFDDEEQDTIDGTSNGNDATVQAEDFVDLCESTPIGCQVESCLFD